MWTSEVFFSQLRSQHPLRTGHRAHRDLFFNQFVTGLKKNKLTLCSLHPELAMGAGGKN